MRVWRCAVPVSELPQHVLRAALPGAKRVKISGRETVLSDNSLLLILDTCACVQEGELWMLLGSEGLREAVGTNIKNKWGNTGSWKLMALLGRKTEPRLWTAQFR